MSILSKIGYVLVFSGLLSSLIGWVLVLIDNNKEDLQTSVTVLGSLPAILDALKAAQRERDAAVAEWKAVVAENSAMLCCLRDGISVDRSFPHTAAWLAAHDARMKKLGAAEWLEKECADNLERYDTHFYDRTTDSLLEDAAQMRRESGE